MSLVRSQQKRGQDSRQPEQPEQAEQPEQRTAKDRRKYRQHLFSKGYRQHLYFVFDDHDNGYTIHKVSPSLVDGSMQVSMKICAPSGAYAGFFTLAFGSKIVLMQPGDDDVIPVIDVKDHSIRSGGYVVNFPCYPIYFSVGQYKLFSLDIGTFDYYGREPKLGEMWVGKELVYPPFSRTHVSSYVVRPDECILVSSKDDVTGNMVTFIFDTKEFMWKSYSDWVFPFTGRGHYDASLEAFVGLCKDPEKLGYLFSCTIRTGPGDTNPSLNWKCSKETLYSNYPDESHVSATLVHMRRGKFCLVECVSVDGVTADELVKAGAAEEPREIPGSVPHRGHFMYRVKIFSLRYDENGDLKLKHSRDRCYTLPYEASVGFLKADPVAFWL